MTILEALQSYNCKVSFSHRWLVIDLDGRFTVYERKPGAEFTSVIVETGDESLAVTALLSELITRRITC